MLDSADLVGGFEFGGERIPLMNPQRGIFKPRQMAHLLSIKTVFPRRGARVWYDAAREGPVVRIGFLQRGVRCKPDFLEECHRWLSGISPTPAPTRDRAVDARRLHPALRLCSRKR